MLGLSIPTTVSYILGAKFGSLLHGDVSGMRISRTSIFCMTTIVLNLVQTKDNV